MIDDERNRKYVCSRGLLKNCDYFSNTQRSSIRHLLDYPNISVLNDLLVNKKKIPTIYVCSSAIPNFINTLLNKINIPFILVSGDCDESIPNDIFPSKELFDRFISNKNLIHWLCQNYVGPYHPKITLMPIGLDYHTMTLSNMWGPIANPSNQEASLQSLKNSSKPFYERQIKCYANFHFFMTTKFGYDRKDALHNIPSNLVYYEPHKVERLQTWKKQINYAFVISPHGNGLDCHRTWEALVLGCIPIVKTSSIDSLYDELPVLIVKDWKEVTQELLNKKIEEFKHKAYNYEKLTLQYWVQKINSSK